MENEITVKQAVDRLKNAIISDEGYRLGWECNIAMAFKDAWTFNPYDPQEGVTADHIHLVANKAAAAFLDMLTGVDVGDLDGMAALAKIHGDAKPLVGKDGKLTR